MSRRTELLNEPGGLAQRLQRLRRQSGLTGGQLADRAGWGQPKVSKIENGRQLPTDRDLDTWADHCNADDETRALLHRMLDDIHYRHRSWRAAVRAGQSEVQDSYDALGRAATRIRNFEPVFVPGLLQTPDYIRARMVENVRLNGGEERDIEPATAARLRRQEILYHTTKRFEFVISEAVLHTLLCPPETMRAQLDRLLGAIGLSHVTFAVIPFGVQLPVTPQNGFVLFDDLAVVETFVDETRHRGERASTYHARMDELLAEAHRGEQARQLIIDASDRLRDK